MISCQDCSVVSRFGEGSTGASAQRTQHVLRLGIFFLSLTLQVFFPICLLIVLTVLVCDSSRKPLEVQNIIWYLIRP